MSVITHGDKLQDAEEIVTFCQANNYGEGCRQLPVFMNYMFFKYFTYWLFAMHVKMCVVFDMPYKYVHWLWVDRTRMP